MTQRISLPARIGTITANPRIRLPLRIGGILALVTVIVLGLVAIRQAAGDGGHFAPDGWYYARFEVTAPGGGKAAEEVRKAVAQVELTRLDALGVRQVRTRMTGDGFVLAVAPGLRSLLAALPQGLPVVEFHPVLAVNKPNGKCAPGRSATILCGRNGLAYTIAPAELTATDLRSAAVQTPASTPGWTVAISLTGRGTARFATLTERLAKEQPPRNALAIAVEGSVISAPSVDSRIPGGRLEIAGKYTQAQAVRLAAPFQAAAAHVRVTHGEISDTPA